MQGRPLETPLLPCGAQAIACGTSIGTIAGSMPRMQNMKENENKRMSMVRFSVGLGSFGLHLNPHLGSGAVICQTHTQTHRFRFSGFGFGFEPRCTRFEAYTAVVQFGAGLGTVCLNLNPHLWVQSSPLPNLNPEVQV
jgi:hypothetical protein